MCFFIVPSYISSFFLIFIHPVGIIFLVPLLAFSVFSFFILAYIKIRMEVHYSTVAYTRNVRLFPLVLGQLADCRICIVDSRRVSWLLRLHETTCRIKKILSIEEVWITMCYELEGRGIGVQFQARKIYFFLTSRPVVGPTQPNGYRGLFPLRVERLGS